MQYKESWNWEKNQCNQSKYSYFTNISHFFLELFGKYGNFIYIRLSNLKKKNAYRSNLLLIVVTSTEIVNYGFIFVKRF